MAFSPSTTYSKSTVTGTLACRRPEEGLRAAAYHTLGQSEEPDVPHPQASDSPPAFAPIQVDSDASM